MADSLWVGSSYDIIAGGGGNFTDAALVTLGTQIYFTGAGAVTGVAFYRNNSSASATGTVYLWRITGTDTGTLVASKAYSGHSGTGWQTVSFDTPYTIDPAQNYVVGWRQALASGTAYYCADSGYFGSPLTSPGGSITAPANSTATRGITFRNGVYDYDTVVRMPFGQFGAASYFIDPVFEPASTGSVGSSSGAATAQATGASNRAAAGASAGVATAQATGDVAGSIGSGAGACAGVATALATGAATSAATGAGSGLATAQATGSATFAAVGAVAGISTASAVGEAQAAGSGAGSASGSSTAQATGASISAATGASSGVATVTGVAYSDAPVAVQGDGDILGRQFAVKRSKRDKDPRSAMQRLIDQFLAANAPKVKNAPKAVQSAVKAGEKAAQTIIPKLAPYVPPATLVRWDEALDELRQSQTREAEQTEQLTKAIAALRDLEKQAREAEEEDEAIMLLLAA